MSRIFGVVQDEYVYINHIDTAFPIYSHSLNTIHYSIPTDNKQCHTIYLTGCCIDVPSYNDRIFVVFDSNKGLIVELFKTDIKLFVILKYKFLLLFGVLDD